MTMSPEIRESPSEMKTMSAGPAAKQVSIRTPLAGVGMLMFLARMTIMFSEDILKVTSAL